MEAAYPPEQPLVNGRLLRIEPLIDHWYLHFDKGQTFQVIDLDETAGLIEIQHFDGDIEELSLDDWRLLEIDVAEDPENWSGVMDISEIDDLGTEITDTSSEDWLAPLAEIHPNHMLSIEDDPDHNGEDRDNVLWEVPWEGEI